MKNPLKRVALQSHATRLTAGVSLLALLAALISPATSASATVTGAPIAGFQFGTAGSSDAAFNPDIHGYLNMSQGFTAGNNFTVEGWVYSSNWSLENAVVMVGASDNAHPTNNALTVRSLGPNSWSVDQSGMSRVNFTMPSGSMVDSTWNYVVAVQDANGVGMWLNGTSMTPSALCSQCTQVSAGHQKFTTSFTGTSTEIGAWSGNNWDAKAGVVNGLRLSNEALYSSLSTTVAVPTAQLGALASTKLLLNYDPANPGSFVDSSTLNQTLTPFGQVTTFRSSTDCFNGTPVVNGGTISNANGRRFHTFTAAAWQSLNIAGGALDAEVFAVGGGGGGGGFVGGGGGAGGVQSQSLSLPAGTYAAYAGEGGVGGSGFTSAGDAASQDQDRRGRIGGNSSLLDSNSRTVLTGFGGTGGIGAGGQGGSSGVGGRLNANPQALSVSTSVFRYEPYYGLPYPKIAAQRSEITGLTESLDNHISARNTTATATVGGLTLAQKRSWIGTPVTVNAPDDSFSQLSFGIGKSVLAYSLDGAQTNVSRLNSIDETQRDITVGANHYSRSVLGFTKLDSRGDETKTDVWMYTAGQGFAGGAKLATAGGGAGGGGYATPGQDSPLNSSDQGRGSAGITYYGAKYAGGGDGGANNNGAAPATSGSGLEYGAGRGGWNSSTPQNATDALAGSGSGGGGGGNAAAGNNGGAGGSGVVIVSYLCNVTRQAQSTLVITPNSGISGGSLSLATTGGSGSGAVTYVVDSGDCTVSGSTLSNATAGDCSVTATKASDATYDQISSASISINFAACLVTYDYDGATSGNSRASDSAACNATPTLVTPPSPTKSGYAFMGWNSSNNFDGTWYGSAPYPQTATSQFALVSTHSSLYAKWLPTSASLNFVSDNQTVATRAFNIGDPVTSWPSDPTRAGYTFNGWLPQGRSTPVAFSGSYYPVLTDLNSLPNAPGDFDDGRYSLVGAWSATAHYVPTYSANHYTAAPVATYSNGINYMAVRDNAGNAGKLLNGVPDGYWMIPLSTSATLTASWTRNSYSVTYNTHRGSSITSATFDVATDVAQPAAPTRAGFAFQGWSLTDGGSAITFPYHPGVTSNITLHALWVQNSLAGLSQADLGSAQTINASGTYDVTTTVSIGNTSSAVKVPTAALPSGSVISIYTLANNNLAESVISNTKTYLISQVISWLDPNGDVPDAITPIEMTIIDTVIRAGAKVYALIGGSYTVVGTATQDGRVVAHFTSDPIIVVAQADPVVAAPQPPAASGNGGSPTPTPPVVTPRPEPTPTPTPPVVKPMPVTSAKQVTGFAPGSAVVSEPIRQMVEAFILAHPKRTKLTCTGYTSGPTVLKVDRALATKRAMAVCSYIAKLKPQFKKYGTRTVNTTIKSASYRKVQVSIF